METSRLVKDLEFCIDRCGFSDEQTTDMISAADSLDVCVEYFCEEFLFITDDPDDIPRLHDDDYLRINWSLG
tara:strand:+ start:1291 stop:1506 length:216 start_codon:yes stop_codon:yes gene_type:complete